MSEVKREGRVPRLWTRSDAVCSVAWYPAMDDYFRHALFFLLSIIIRIIESIHGHLGELRVVF